MERPTCYISICASLTWRGISYSRVLSHKRCYFMMLSKFTGCTMNADEPEPGDLQAADQAKSLNAISTSNQHEGDASGWNRRSQILERRRITNARRSMSETCRLQRPIAESVSSQALHIFLYNTVIHFPSGSTSQGHFTSLVALTQSPSRLEALPFALDAVALASLAHRFSHPDAKTLAMSRYQASIRSLRDTDISSESNLLGVIACIQLLGMYEVRATHICWFWLY